MPKPMIRTCAACLLLGAPAGACLASANYVSQQRSVRGWIAIATNVVVYDETVSAPNFASFDETIQHSYFNEGQSAGIRATQLSRLDPNEIRFAGEVVAGNQHQTPFPTPGSRATSQLLTTFTVSTPTVFELSGTVAGGFISSVYREYSLSLTSGAQTILSRSSAGGINWVDLDLTGNSAIRGTLPVGTYQLAVVVQTSGGSREGGTTTYDLSLQVPSPAALALPLAALPLAIRRRRNA